jgi:acetate kinase|tara:strand:- start:677 stop:871 length:195 start_codon:yes stop_codon:yes gene_type:complete
MRAQFLRNELGTRENVPFVRERIAEDLRNFLQNFRARILVIPTNEDMMISQETAGLLKGLRGQD